MRPLALFTSLFLASTARAIDYESPFASAGVKARVSLIEENDKFSPRNLDRYYTQGLKLIMASGDHAYASLTQEINTPADTLSSNPSLDDLPYSGALYFGYGYGTVLDRGGRRDCLVSLELQFGMIGPAAGGTGTQNNFHHLVGLKPAAGWRTQIPNEPVVNLNGEFRRRFNLDAVDRGYRDLIVRSLIDLGTIRTEFITGLQLRLGLNLDRSWGHSYIRHSNGYDPIFVADANDLSPDFSAWGFADTQLEVVVHNYSIDGTSLSASRGVTRRPVVLQFALGAAFQLKAVSASFFTAVRSTEFDTQDGMHFYSGFKGDFRY